MVRLAMEEVFIEMFGEVMQRLVDDLLSLGLCYTGLLDDFQPFLAISYSIIQ
jgi:hypothetical protein